MLQESAGQTLQPDLERVVDGVLRASRALVAVAARSIAHVDDAVTLPQFRALVVLAGRGPQNVGSLADELGVHGSTATRMCDRLVDRGFVDRDVSAHSRREVTVRLTPAGRRLLRDVTAVRRRAIGEIVAKVPDELRSPMIGALQAFSEAAGEVPDQAWTVGWDRVRDG
jgi:DNA-binding MarR family transcriptional regulator